MFGISVLGSEKTRLKKSAGEVLSCNEPITKEVAVLIGNLSFAKGTDYVELHRRLNVGYNLTEKVLSDRKFQSVRDVINVLTILSKAGYPNKLVECLVGRSDLRGRLYSVTWTFVEASKSVQHTPNGIVVPNLNNFGNEVLLELLTKLPDRSKIYLGLVTRMDYYLSTQGEYRLLSDYYKYNKDLPK